MGTSRSADFVGEYPSTAWVKSINGNAMPVMANPTVVIAALDSEKLRSRNSDSGTSGSPRMWPCHQMKTPSTTTPNPISSGTERNPVMVPQS